MLHRLTGSILLGLCPSQAGSGSVPVPRDISDTLAAVLLKSDLPALGGAIVTSAGLEAIGAVGLREWEGASDVTVDDQWHIGSCTKTMTATLAARLIERGLLSWETTVGDVFGEGLPNMDPGWRDVSIHWLLCHRSGASLNFTQAIWDQMEQQGGTPRAQRSLFVAEGLSLAPSTRPNTETVYSNAGYMVAGAMLERLADASWEDLVRREVFEPLGIGGCQGSCRLS